jgi:hypothetical protein
MPCIEACSELLSGCRRYSYVGVCRPFYAPGQHPLRPDGSPYPFVRLNFETVPAAGIDERQLRIAPLQLVAKADFAFLLAPEAVVAHRYQDVTCPPDKPLTYEVTVWNPR